MTACDNPSFPIVWFHMEYNNNINLYLHYSGRGKSKEEKKQSIENKIMEDLQLYIYVWIFENGVEELDPKP